MADAAVEAAYTRIVDAVAEVLRPLGYRKHGAAFRKLVDDNCAIVSFQRSRRNTATEVRFTLNTAIVCGRLLTESDPPLAQTQEYHGHLRRRIGEFTFWERDKWWTLKPSTNVERIARDLTALVQRKAAPFLEAHLPTIAVRTYLASGRGRGVMNIDREAVIAALDRILAD